MTELLMQKGANYNDRNLCMKTPFDLARQYQHYEVLLVFSRLIEAVEKFNEQIESKALVRITRSNAIKRIQKFYRTFKLTRNYLLHIRNEEEKRKKMEQEEAKQTKKSQLIRYDS